MEALHYTLDKVPTHFSEAFGLGKLGHGAPSKVISDYDKNYSKHFCKKTIYFVRTKFLQLDDL